jgi:TRAP-type transport system periplasmic protein
MKFTNLLIATGVAVSIGLGMTTSAFAGSDKVLKLAHLNKNDPFDNATGAMVTVFKNLVESGTNGSVKVQIFPSGQLGKDAEVLQQVKAGVIQSGIHSTGGMASVYPLIGALDVPFAFPNISATYPVFDGPFGDKLAASIEKKTGLYVLGFGDSGGFFNFTNSKRPIKTLEDFKGMKIRTMGLETHKALIRSLGGQPAGIAWSEVYTALQTGVADGQMNPVPIIAFAKFNEVQKYLTLSKHLFTPYVWVMNKKFYDSLTASEKDVVAYAARSAIVAGRGISRIIEASERGLPALAENLEVYTLPESERAKFQAAALPAVKGVIKKTFGAEGEDMMNAYLAAIKDVSN